MTVNSEHKIDPEVVANRLDVAPGAIKHLLENLPSDVTVTEFHAYGYAIGIVELEEELAIAHSSPEPYAIASVTGHIFPFHPSAVDELSDLMERSNHDFSTEQAETDTA